MKVPDRVFIEPFNWFTFLIKKSIDRQTFVSIMCGHVIGYDSARNAQTPSQGAGDSREYPTLPILDRSTSSIELLQYRLTAMPISRSGSTTKVFAPVAFNNAFVVDTIDNSSYMTTHLDGIISTQNCFSNVLC